MAASHPNMPAIRAEQHHRGAPAPTTAIGLAAKAVGLSVAAGILLFGGGALAREQVAEFATSGLIFK